MFDFWGKDRARTETNQQKTLTTTLSKKSLRGFREKFPMWKDADGL
jgi:hypothetical protein